MAKSFSWSWSKLKNYRSCPKRHYEIDLARNFHEDKENEALRWGNEVHLAMAKRISEGAALPITMQRYDGWPSGARRLKDAGLPVEVERSLAIDRNFQPCGWLAPEAWFRAKIDVSLLVESAKAAISIDWKTGGKVEPEFEQLFLSSQAIFAHHPNVDEVAALYVWLGHDMHTAKVYQRDQMGALWSNLWPEIEQMFEAWRTVTYPPKPSGLCVRHCPVTSCPYHGKGNR